MLHILLVILKIIGIVLAILLGLILVAILCVLFVPIRYWIKAEGKLGEEEPVRVKIKVHWLLHIVNVAFSYPEAAGLKMRLFCFRIFDSSKQKEKQNGKAIGKDKHSEELVDEIQLSDKNAEEHLTKEKNQLAKESKNVEKTAEITPMNTLESTEAEQDTKETDADFEKKEKGIVKKIKDFIHAVKDLLHQIWEALKNIEYTIRQICDKIKKIIENIRYYTEVIKSDVFQSAWGVCQKQLLKILRMLKPQKCRVNLLIGTGDPAGTGQLLSIYGMLYPFLGNHVFLQTDFENQVVEGDLYIKGRVRCFVLLMAALKLYMNKDIRHLLKLLKREEM